MFWYGLFCCAAPSVAASGWSDGNCWSITETKNYKYLGIVSPGIVITLYTLTIVYQESIAYTGTETLAKIWWTIVEGQH